MPGIQLHVHSGKLDNHTVLELSLEVTRIEGIQGINSCLLRLPSNIRPTIEEYRAIEIFSCTGHLFFGSHTLQGVIRPWVNKDRIAVSEIMQLPQRDSSQLQFNFPIDRVAIETTEERRNGQDFLLTLAIDAVLYWADQSEKEFMYAQGSVPFEMHRSYWQDKVLEKWDFMAHHVVQWSAPKILNTKLAKVHEEYKKAEQCFLKDDWDGTVVNLRKCYESLTSLRKWDLKGEKAYFDNRLQAMKKQLLEGLIGKTWAEMIADMITSQRRMLSAATKAGSRPLNRQTASLALKVASVVISYVSEGMEGS